MKVKSLFQSEIQRAEVRFHSPETYSLTIKIQPFRANTDRHFQAGSGIHLGEYI